MKTELDLCLFQIPSRNPLYLNQLGNVNYTCYLDNTIFFIVLLFENLIVDVFTLYHYEITR